MLEIVERHGALADADRLRQPDARGFVAHVRAIGKIIGAEGACIKLVEKGGLVRGAAGCVELGLIGMVKGLQPSSDLLERLFPFNDLEAVGLAVVTHRMRQPAGVLQFVIGPGPEFGDGVLGEEARAGTLDGRLPGHRLRAILAELEGGSVLRVGPGTAGAIEPGGLVHLQEGPRAAAGSHLVADGARYRTKSALTSCRSCIGLHALGRIVRHLGLRYRLDR